MRRNSSLMSRLAMTQVALMLSGKSTGHSPSTGPERMIEPPTPRRFTDARIAEAEAKRERKRAKRAAQFHKKGK